MAAKRWLVTLVESLLIAWALLYLATYFDVPFVREAGGRVLRSPVPTEYPVPLLAVAVAGQRLLPSSGRMTAVLIALLASLRTTIRSRCELGAEILALRHQLAVLQRTRSKPPHLRPIDRLLWVLL
jgi:hypothetical protein